MASGIRRSEMAYKEMKMKNVGLAKININEAMAAAKWLKRTENGEK